MRQLALASTAGVAILLCGCTEPATSQTEQAIEQTVLGGSPSGVYTNDKGHTYVGFSYDHLGFSRSVLRFSDVDARVDLNSNDVGASTISVTIQADSLDTGVPELDERLAREDFFDMARFPEITFVSTSLTQSAPDTGVVEGEMTIKGVTRPATLNVTLNGAGLHPRDQFPTLGVSATTTLSRSAFDLGYLVPHVGDEIEVQIEAEFNLRE